MRMICGSIVMVVISLMHSSCAKDTPGPDVPDQPEETVTLTMVDEQATAETKALYANLWKITEEGFMFGHHDDLIYGREWIDEPGRSDVKEICGDYPAVFSVDLAEIMDDRNATSNLNEARKRAMLEARARGEVIIACAHLNNPLTGGDSWDNSSHEVAKQILTPGSDTQQKFDGWIDNLADFLHSLKDTDGHPVPIIFRPFHEHTQTWSWWGKACTSQEEFTGLWQYTINSLKNDHNIHQLIYAISPQLDSPGTTDQLQFRWPGDDYVDFLGMDSYHGTNTNSLSTNAGNLEKLSRQLNKPCGITETGIEGIVDGSGAEYENYWTKEILTPLLGKEVSMVVMWRNKYDPTHTGHHFFGPYIGHSSSDDFLDFYESSFSLFSSDLPDMYVMPDNVEVR